MHPADKFAIFKRLAEDRGAGTENIAARFGVTPHVVHQRLRLVAHGGHLPKRAENRPALVGMTAGRLPRVG